MRKPKRMFVVKITTKNQLKECDYLPNTDIYIPVLARSINDAWKTVENNCNGSECPCYLIMDIFECDQYLFRPILKE